jgi:predicted phage-related endonuclease
MYPAADEAAVVNLPSRAEQLADQILAANADIKDAEGKRSEAETELKAMLGQASKGTVGRFEIRWPMRSYKAQPKKVVPAKDAYSIRQSTLSIKEAL